VVLRLKLYETPWSYLDDVSLDPVREGRDMSNRGFVRLWASMLMLTVLLVGGGAATFCHESCGTGQFLVPDFREV